MRLVIAAALIASAAFQDPAPAKADAPLTCDAGAIKPDSYKLTVEAQALNVTKPYYRWWDNYDIGRKAKDVEDASDAAIVIAERARELDERNLLAHAQLARLYVTTGVEAKDAHEAWKRTLDAGGAIVWMATLQDVDARAYFLLAFDRQGIRIYKFGQLAGAFKTDFGVPVLPGPDREELWRALGGCLSEGVAPEATIPWSSVRELASGNFVLWFELDRPIAIESDRRKRRTSDTLTVSLHGTTGDFDPRMRYPLRYRGVVMSAAAYQERVRGTLVQFFDPDGRIKLPKQRRTGW